MKAISVFGVFVADLCFISNTIPEKGQTVLGSQHIIGPGGKGSNQAIAAAKLDGSERRAFVMLGDGEIQEGSVWEAAMAAAHHELGNLKVILDRNRIQNDDFCETQMRMFDIPAKWRAFGWNVKEINGHDMNEVVEGMNYLSETNDGPSILIAHTVKGKGVSFMEDNPSFHGAAPNDEQYALALSELGVAV